MSLVSVELKLFSILRKEFILVTRSSTFFQDDQKSPVSLDSFFKTRPRFDKYIFCNFYNIFGVISQ